jgi:hypothetical protein
LRFGEDRQSCRHRNTDTAITLTLLRNAVELRSPALSGKEQTMAEALIRGRIEDLVKALNAKDIDGVISLFAPILVSFDIAPLFGALRYFGAENKRRAWQEAFATLRYIYWPLLLRGTRVERHAAGGGVGLRS